MRQLLIAIYLLPLPQYVAQVFLQETLFMHLSLCIHLFCAFLLLENSEIQRLLSL
jgi:hypothetical protein